MPASKKMTVKVVKPFCKVCHDAGKSESEYTSHFVRSDTGPNSKVICPTLLAQECRYCCKIGHTVKFCPVLVDQNKTDTKTAKKGEFLEAQVNKPITKKHKKKQNAFEVLDFESDSEKEEVKITPINIKEEKQPEKPKKDEFPALSSKSGSISAVPVLTGYANIAAKTRSQFEAEQEQYAAEKYEKEMIERSIKGAKQVNKKEVPVKPTSWADWDSDDDEEDRVILSRPAPWVSYKKAEEIVDETW
jgi:hypothetical protein